MNRVKVISVDDLNGINFDNGINLNSNHDQDCCEQHFLSFQDININDFDNLEFDLTGDFFERIEDYGIALKPIIGHPIRIPGYADNNGYYSSELTLVLSKEGFKQTFDISECQQW